MTAPDLQRARELFEQASAMPEDEREAFLLHNCRGDAPMAELVRGLLARQEGATPADQLADGTATRAPVPARVGQYAIRSVLGEGGFGTVYLAEQTQPIRRAVALKVIKPGMDSRAVIARFEQERQALALLDHPNIAKVLDAGSDELGRPYFVMEYVAGAPITTYCDEHQLDTRRRLDLLAEVCDAVQHAHSKGIIHRDLKPSNVLVVERDGAPAPMVIDFGVAKAIDDRLSGATRATAEGILIGTPEYMSPEQAAIGAGAVDTRADVYSLGVLLYELLTGSLPFPRATIERGGLAELHRQIREDEPPPPSTRVASLGESLGSVSAQRGAAPKTLLRLLRGELDWIALKAMDKNRDRRYQTAAALADDLRRYLGHEPVQAGPPSRAYRIRKFARRHRALVGASVAVAASLVLLGAGLLYSYGQVRHERDAARSAQQTAQQERQRALASELNVKAAAALAQAEAAKAKAVVDMLTDVMSAADPGTSPGGENTLLRDVLDRIATRVDGGAFKGQPAIEGLMQHTLGSAYYGLGMYEQAEQRLQAAVERRRAAGSNPEELADSLSLLAQSLKDQGQTADAEAAFREAYEIRLKLHGPRDRNTALSLAELLIVLPDKPNNDAIYRQAIDGLEQADGATPEEIASAKMSYGAYLKAMERYAEAEKVLREVVGVYRGDEGYQFALVPALGHLATTLERQDKLAEAEQVEGEMVALCRKMYPSGHSSLVQGLATLGDIKLASGKIDEAESCFRETVGIARGLPQGNSVYLAKVEYRLAAFLYENRKQYVEASKLAEEALRLSRPFVGPERPELLYMVYTLAEMLFMQDQFAAAAPYYDEALKLARLQFGEGDGSLVQYINGVGSVQLQLKNTAIAEEKYREALAIAEHVFGKTHRETAASLSNLGALLDRQGKLNEAQELYQRAATILEALPNKQAEGLAIVYDNLGDIASKRGQLNTAEGIFRHELELLRSVVSDPDLDIAQCQHNIGVMLLKQGRPSDAEPLIRAALAARTQLLGEDHRLVRQTNAVLGAVLLEKPDFAAAEPLVLLGYETAETPDLRKKSLDRIISMYERWGKPGEAEAWRRKGLQSGPSR